MDNRSGGAVSADERCGARCAVEVLNGTATYACILPFGHEGEHAARAGSGKFTWPKTLREYR